MLSIVSRWAISTPQSPNSSKLNNDLHSPLITFSVNILKRHIYNQLFRVVSDVRDKVSSLLGYIIRYALHSFYPFKHHKRPVNLYLTILSILTPLGSKLNWPPQEFRRAGLTLLTESMRDR